MTRRGPYRKGEAKRAEILQTALEIFAVEGYRGTSLRKVAAQCGLSMPGIMHYFDSREDLLTQVLMKRDEEASARHITPTWTPQGALEVIRANEQTPGLIELFVSLAAAASDTSHPAHPFFDERYRCFRATLADRLREAQEADRVRADLPPERLASLMLAVIDGMQLQWMTDRSVDMGRAVTDLFHLFGWTPPD